MNYFAGSTRRRSPQTGDGKKNKAVDVTVLSPREAELYSLMQGAGKVADHAKQMGVSRQTARSYVKTMYRKLGIHSRAELMLSSHTIILGNARTLTQDERTSRIACYEVYRSALRIGFLRRGPCEVCGNLNTDGHHTNYQRPLDVKWLCREHHIEAHRKGKQDENAAAYRRSKRK